MDCEKAFSNLPQQHFLINVKVDKKTAEEKEQKKTERLKSYKL